MHNGMYWDRLSSLDAAFLQAEVDGVHMHLCSMMRFGPSALNREDGSVNLDALKERVLDMIEGEPRLRQRLAWSPLWKHPYWVDDANFRLSYHLRHTALPQPGDDRQLKRLMGRILSQPLDRQRPLWEQWVVEGLEGGGFAVILKVHHCILDGMGAMGLLARLVADVRGKGELPPARPRPSREQLWRLETAHRGGVLRWKREGRKPKSKTGTSAEAWSGARALAKSFWQPATASPLNPPQLSGHRRFDVVDIPFSSIRSVKNSQKSTVNDVVLAIVTGALQRHFRREGSPPAALSPFRALVPANTRAPSHSEKLGNQVAMMLVDLPLDEGDASKQLTRIRDTTHFLKTQSHEVDSGRWLSEVDDRLGLGIMGHVFRYSGWLRSFNVIVTNVPGPPVPVKVFGAPLRSFYGAVPLTSGVALGVAVFSYNGRLFFGLHADRDAVEDLHVLAQDFREAHTALCSACGVSPERSEGDLSRGIPS